MEIKLVDKYGKFLSGIDVADNFYNNFSNLINNNVDSFLRINFSNIEFIDLNFAFTLANCAKHIQSRNIITYFTNVSFVCKKTLDNVFMEKDLFSIVENEGNIEFIGNFASNLKEIIDTLSVKKRFFSLDELCTEIGVEEKVCENRINKLVNMGYVINKSNKYQLALVK